MAPDDTIPGLINLFTMTPTGAPLNAVAAVTTSDQEYPKSGTLHCSWAAPICYFLTGVARPYTQDAIYGVNRTTGATIFKHEVPAGIYLDNLAYDWGTDSLYSIAFDPQTRSANLVTYNGLTGAVTILLDISADIANGFVYSGSVSVCPTTKTLYVGVDANVGQDFILSYDISAATPVKVTTTPLAFPITSGLRAFCNATALQGVVGDFIMGNSDARETLVVADTVSPGREGLLFPLGTADLPSFAARGEIELFLNGMLSEFNGQFIIPLFPPFQAGPGPAPQLPGSLVFSWQYGTREGTLSPIGYYLVGASACPGR